MEMKRVVYIPEAEITFTPEDLRLLSDLAESHYDHTCRSAGQLGGFLYGLRIASNGHIVTQCLKFREIDILAKITEMSHEARHLHAGFSRILKTLNEVA